MNIETYAIQFLLSRGLRASEEMCVDTAAKVFLEEQGVQLKLSDLRAMGAMAQFNKKEMRADVLELIEQTGNLNGDTWVSMDATSVRVLPLERHESVIQGGDVL